MEDVKYELADVVRKFGKELVSKQTLSPMQMKALNNIVSCRTAQMGWNEYACDTCGAVKYHYNSCGDRHCPKCLSTKQALWIDKLLTDTLPVKHYHIVFTVPHCLNDICLWNDRLYYKLLFRAVWKTLRTFGYTNFGCETGAVAVLHTWGQNLSLHPHIHCIVPAVGYSLQGQWKHIGKYANYLYCVQQLSDSFKMAFLDSLKRSLRKLSRYSGFYQQVQKAFATNWVVNSQASMADSEHVVRYLGQYTHRIAIANDRIININDTHVKFWAKNYRKKGPAKPTSLPGIEFLKRFCQHVMPKGFVRIRRYGIYHHTSKRNLDLEFFTPAQQTSQKLEVISESKQEKIKRITGFDPEECPCCKQGKLVIVHTQPRIRSPAQNLVKVLISNLL